jgi:hypothetical protein
MEKVGIFFGRLEYIAAIWYMLWPFSNIEVIYYIFPSFGILCQEKSGTPALSNSSTLYRTRIYSPFTHFAINSCSVDCTVDTVT